MLRRLFSMLWRCPCGCSCGMCQEGRHRGRTWGWTVPNVVLSVKRIKGDCLLTQEEAAYLEAH